MAAETLMATAVVFTLFFVTTAVGDRPEEQQQQERHSPSTKPALANKFVGVTSRCSRGSLTVDVRTEESFSGSVYARGYPSRCRVMGTGTTVTSLTVPAQKCGVKVIEDELGHHTYELLVYIQFDKWVQQVIDEQVHIRCKLDRDAGELRAAAQMSVVSKDALTVNERRAGRTKDKNNSIAAIVTAASSNRALSSSSSSRSTGLTTSSVGSKQGHPVSQRHKSLSLRSRAQYDPMKDWQPISAPPELLLWQSQRPEGNLEPVSCWMDIVAGKTMDGKPVLDFLLVGDDTTMVLKVRQSPGLDTRITSCVAHDGSGDQSQELIDEHGCAIDDDIMPPLRIKNNQRTGVKVAYASFKAFKFPDRDNLHLRCIVLVCLGSCSLPVCGRTTNRVGRRLGGPGEGSIQPILDIEETQPARLQQGSRGNDRALASRLLDRVEVFNSVEVRAPGIESQPDLVKQYRIDREPTDSVDFFSTPKIRLITMVQSLNIFTCSLVYCGLSLSGNTYSVDPFLYIIIGGLMEVPGYTITAPIIARWGRKPPIIIGFFLSGASILALAFTPSDISWLVMLLAMIGKLAISAVFMIVFVYEAELLPTEVRLQGVAVVFVAGQIAATCSPYLADFMGPLVPWLPSVIFGVMSFLSGLSIFPLPETLGMALPDTISDLEELFNQNKSNKADDKEELEKLQA